MKNRLSRSGGRGRTPEKSRICAILAMLGGVIAPAAAAAEINAYGTLASEYIYRGLAASAGDPAVQLALDYQHDSGFFVGAWASSIRIDNTPEVSRRIELDYYGGWHYDPRGPWSASATLMRYTYPRAKGDFDYDHSEWLVSARWLDRYSVEVAYTPNLYGIGRPGRHVQFGTRWPVAGGWIVSGAVGRNDLSSLGLDRYLHWDVGASASFARVTLDLRWYDNESTYTGGYGGHAADSRVVVSVSAAF